MTYPTIVIIPDDRLGSLDIPPLALDTGAPNPEWVDLPIGFWQFRRTPSLRLPFSPDVARKARWRIRIAPYTTAATVILVVAYLTFLTLLNLDRPYRPPFPFPFPFVLLLGQLPLSFLSLVRAVKQMPRWQPGGVRLPAVPAEVAWHWQGANPGLVVTTTPGPRWFPRRVYAFSAAGLILAAIVLGVIVATDNREDFIFLYMAVPGLVIAGLIMAIKIPRPGYISLDR